MNKSRRRSRMGLIMVDKNDDDDRPTDVEWTRAISLTSVYNCRRRRRCILERVGSKAQEKI